MPKALLEQQLTLWSEGRKGGKPAAPHSLSLPRRARKPRLTRSECVRARAAKRSLRRSLPPPLSVVRLCVAGESSFKTALLCSGAYCALSNTAEQEGRRDGRTEKKKRVSISFRLGWFCPGGRGPSEQRRYIRFIHDCKRLLNTKSIMRWRSLCRYITVTKIYSMQLYSSFMEVRPLFNLIIYN